MLSTDKKEKEFDELFEKSPDEIKHDLDKVADRLLYLREIKEKISNEMKKLEDEIVSQVPIDIGDFFVSGANSDFTVSRNELFSWDDEVFSALVPTLPLPDYIKVSYSIPKKDYKGLDETTRKSFEPALTRKPGAAKIKIAKK